MYLLTAAGRLLVADLTTLRVEPVADVAAELRMKDSRLIFKAGHQAGRMIFVAASAPDGQSGCLAQWDGTRWTVVDRAAYGEVTDLASMSQNVVATGCDRVGR